MSHANAGPVDPHADSASGRPQNSVLHDDAAPAGTTLSLWTDDLPPSRPRRVACFFAGRRWSADGPRTRSTTRYDEARGRGFDAGRTWSRRSWRAHPTSTYI